MYHPTDGFEAAMTNEFHDQEFACAQLIPSGGSYTTDGGNFACATAGSKAGSTFVNGDAYLKAALNYEHSHLWRNVGSESTRPCGDDTDADDLRMIVIAAYWILFVLLTAFAVERLKAAGSEKSFLLFSRDSSMANSPPEPMDEEHGKIHKTATGLSAERRAEAEKMKAELQQTDTVFTWRGVNYTVDVKGGKRQLLNDVQGYARPGQLLALMGSSGAGKSTLLDTLVSTSIVISHFFTGC